MHRVSMQVAVLRREREGKAAGAGTTTLWYQPGSEFEPRSSCCSCPRADDCSEQLADGSPAYAAVPTPMAREVHRTLGTTL